LTWIARKYWITAALVETSIRVVLLDAAVPAPDAETNATATTNAAPKLSIPLTCIVLLSPRPNIKAGRRPQSAVELRRNTKICLASA
jgi:hypothetical protein